MTPRNRARALALAAAFTSAAALGGCGKMGELDRPAPMFGKAAPASSPAEQKDQQRRKSGSSNPARPVRTIDPRDIGMDPSPPRVDPIPGQSPDPTAVQPPGVLPDPYARPR